MINKFIKEKEEEFDDFCKESREKAIAFKRFPAWKKQNDMTKCFLVSSLQEYNSLLISEVEKMKGINLDYYGQDPHDAAIDMVLEILKDNK